MRTPSLLAAPIFLALSWTLGCVEVAAVEPVTVVPTRTPGVTFVVVRPVVQGQGDKHRVQPRDNKQVDPNSQYILLCDARPADGMRCSVPTEAALARYSYTPMTGNADAPIDEGVGTLSDISTHVTKDEEKKSGAEGAPAESPPPPPPPASEPSKDSSKKEGK